jgi:electron transport complex protein RnfG
MARKESTFLNMVVTLLIITMASSAALGFIFKVTEQPIAKAEEYKKNLAMQLVLEDYDSIPIATIKQVLIDKDIIYCFKAVKDSLFTGMAVQTFATGYGGPIKLMVGFRKDGSIKEIAVLGHMETAGLGDQILKSKSDWCLQFEGVNPNDFVLKLKKDGGDVDAITGSTITSNAYCKAVQKASDAFEKVMKNETME